MKILILNLRQSLPKEQINELTTAIKSHFAEAKIELCARNNELLECENIENFYLYENKKLGIFKQIFAELKFIMKLKKQKFTHAIITPSSTHALMLAKQAKIKRILATPTTDASASSHITHSISEPINAAQVVEILQKS